MDNNESLKALETYFSLMCMNGGTHIFKTASECGIFKQLSSGPQNLVDLSTSCGLQERPLKLLLEVLGNLNVVNQQEGLYALSGVMQLLQGNYQNLSDEYWQHLQTFLKTETPIKEMDSVEESEAHYKSQVKALEWMMTPSSIYAAKALGIGIQRTGLKILDIGAGSAIWSLSCAGMDSQSTVTAIDWPQVLEVAKASAKLKGVDSRFSALSGNYHDVPLENSSYDLAIIANVTHLESTDGNQKLFDRAFSALKPGGELIVIDVFGDQSKGKLAAGLYNLGLALRTKSAVVYSKEELTELLEKSQFKTSYIPLEVTPYTMGMIIAKKEERND